MKHVPVMLIAETRVGISYLSGLAEFAGTLMPRERSNTQHHEQWEYL